ncbi:sensor histidine kinase, partial [Glycomyces tenuis]|uniref:sensor histidine kinase n=1 Tax=Glycomyces tenuis TaxID=58116 RepID=UPI00068D5549
MQRNEFRPSLLSILADVGIAFVLGLLVSGATFGANNGHHPGGGALALIWLCAAMLTVRRVWPEAALFGSTLALWYFVAMGYPEGPIYLLPAVAVFSYVMARPLKSSLLLLGGLMVAFPLFYEFVIDDPNRLVVNIAISFIYLSIPTVGGVIAREARNARAQAAEAKRDRHRADERVAMAREIHDVVGHSLAVVSMNAGVALHVLEKRPDAAPGVIENLRAIRDTSTRALDDLRATLIPLRQGEQPELRPAFSLVDVPTLIDDIRKGGLAVDCDITGDIEAVPQRIATTAYRVVQEALTNVIRHAEATRATARIDCGPERLVIDIGDNGRGGEVDPDRVGQGITGMMERVEAHGGTFRAGPASGGGFAVHAELPYAHSANLWLASVAKEADLWLAGIAKGADSRPTGFTETERAHDRARHRRRPVPHPDGPAHPHRRRARHAAPVSY